MEPTYRWYVGIDWGSEAHAVVLLNDQGQLRGTWEIPHTPVALHSCMTEILARTGTTPDAIAIGLEIPRGLIVDAAIERGFAVFALNPKQLDRFRDRHTVAGAKDDQRDAYVVADSLRTDQHRFRRIQPNPALLIEVREYVQMLDELEREQRRLANQLRDQLVRVAPQWVTLASGADEPWFWTLVEQVLTSDGPRAVRTPRLARLLREHRITRWSADDVRASADAGAVLSQWYTGYFEAFARHIDAATLKAEWNEGKRQLDEIRTHIYLLNDPEKLGAPGGRFGTNWGNIMVAPDPDLPADARPPDFAQQSRPSGDAAILREALRLRVRWLQEITGRAAWLLGLRLARTGALADPAQVRSISLVELDAIITNRAVAVPTLLALADGAARAARPLPACFQVSDRGRPIPVRRGSEKGGGTGAGGGVGTGRVTRDAADPPNGSVLVTTTLTPGLGPLLPRLSGIIAETGSVLAHLAILARESGVATVVGFADATAEFPEGTSVTVNGDTGDVTVLDEEVAQS